MKKLDCDFGSKDVPEFFSLFQEGRLNLEPAFQRQSDWSLVLVRKIKY